MKNYLLGYLISGITLSGSVWLASTGGSGWPWFLASGVLLGFTTIGAEVRQSERS